MKRKPKKQKTKKKPKNTLFFFYYVDLQIYNLALNSVNTILVTYFKYLFFIKMK